MIKNKSIRDKFCAVNMQKVIKGLEEILENLRNSTEFSFDLDATVALYLLAVASNRLKAIEKACGVVKEKVKA